MMDLVPREQPGEVSGRIVVTVIHAGLGVVRLEDADLHAVAARRVRERRGRATPGSAETAMISPTALAKVVRAKRRIAPMDVYASSSEMPHCALTSSTWISPVSRSWRRSTRP